MDSIAPKDAAPGGGKAAPAWLNGIWKFLNSAFGLFLLSSLVVNFAARAYADHQAALTERARTRAELMRLMTELELRVFNLDRATKMMVDAQKQPPWMGNPQEFYTDAAHDVVRAIRGASGYAPSSPVYANVHLVSILQQIDLLSGDQLSRVEAPASDGRSNPAYDPAHAALMLEEVNNLMDAFYAGRATALSKQIESYADARRLSIFCGKDSPDRGRLIICAETPEDLEAIKGRVRQTANAKP